MQPFGHNRHGPQIGELLPFLERGLGLQPTQSPGLRLTSTPSGILMNPAAIEHNKNGGKFWGFAPFFGRGWVPTKHHVAWTKAHLHTKCHLDLSSRLVTTDKDQQRGRGLCPLFGEGGAGSPSTTISSGMRPTSVPSRILIHAAVWPQ